VVQAAREASPAGLKTGSRKFYWLSGNWNKCLQKAGRLQSGCWLSFPFNKEIFTVAEPPRILTGSPEVVRNLRTAEVQKQLRGVYQTSALGQELLDIFLKVL